MTGVPEKFTITSVSRENAPFSSDFDSNIVYLFESNNMPIMSDDMSASGCLEAWV